jgi:hypothetical protein
MLTLTDATDDQALLREVVAFYARTLKDTPEALGWLMRRAITSPEVVDHFHLGYANRSLGQTLPPGVTKAGAEVRARLQRVGILRESGHEHLAGSLVVPIFDEHGVVEQLYGRKIGESFRAGTALELWLPGPMRGVWNREALKEREVILACGLLDGLTVWSAGQRNVTAALTLDALPEDVLGAMKARRMERVLVAYPHDDQGDEAAGKVIEALGGLGIAGVRVELPDGVSLNELARRRGVAALLDAIRRARPEPVVVPAPPASADEEPVQVQEAVSTPPPEPVADDPTHEVVIEVDDRRYRVRGLEKNTSYAVMKVNLLVSRIGDDAGSPFHIDSLDLYVARQRAAFVRQAAAELGMQDEDVKRDLGRVLLRLEELQEENIRKTLAPKVQPVVLTEQETAQAMDLLRDPDLLGRILRDFDRLGIVGEEGNKLVGYVAAISRKLDQPLAVVIQSSSAAGKSSLMEAILALVPPEDRLKFAAMTPQSLFYLGATDLRHKVLAVLEDQGAEKVAYGLKILQSEGELNIASTGKEAATGRLVTHEYKVQGPVALFFTTTAVQVDEELLNRCIVLSVSEDREQTRAIHRLQRHRQTLQGLVGRDERDEVCRLHQNAQRLLRPLLVANPFAPQLTFMDGRTRSRRDHAKYLTMIRAIALLRQHQREVKTTVYRGEAVPYIEVTANDIAVANKLADHVFGRSLDELPAHTRAVLAALDKMAAKACEEQRIERSAFRFTRRDVLAATGLSLSQLKVHLARLVELEHVLVHRGRRGELYQYELLYDAKAEPPVLSGLADPTKLEGGEVGDGRGAVPDGSPRDAAPLPGSWPVGGEEEHTPEIEARRTESPVEPGEEGTP